MNTTRTHSGTIAGYFQDPSDAEKAVRDLSQAGIPKKNIGVAVSARQASWTDRIRDMFSPDERSEYEGPDAMDTLRDMGVSEEQRRYYENALRSGGALVTVASQDEHKAEAVRILRGDGALTPNDAGFPDYRTTGRATSSDMGASADRSDSGPHRIQLLGEVLRVHKERLDRGAVTVRKEVVSENQTIEVPTTREELVIERHPGGGQPAGNAQVGADQGEEVRVPLSEERARVEKQPVVREEIEVGKREVQEQQVLSGTVSHEEARIEREGDIDIDEKKDRAA